MVQEEIIKFHKPANQNDIAVVESLIYPIFSKKNKKDKHNWNEIQSLFLSTMKNANLNFFKRHIFWFYVNRTITKGMKKGIPLIKVEETLRKFIRKHVDKEKDRKAYAFKRAKRSFELVADYIVGEKILDLGAGDGLLALEIKKQLKKEVVLVDIVDYNYTDLPLILYNPEEKIPLADEEVGTTILYTVLHHASDPEHLLKEATRITKKRLVIIEGYIEEDDIRVTNSFFDWFYNRVIGDEDINVPLNFLRIKEWEKILKSHGFDIIETIYLGINEPVVPEHQILIIADHVNNS
ncbi:class I SAM-dependent methyltransferase [Candidatus Borrarchaeum sp.]|uniref:class I SAM-dependent methyltransferase n=1 Tax=Candidatus Borrarchaeum sp. TaxID=2846742 RepID=UPI00257FB345|nr:methyltransferase domain-containing protein [Candidatus Borrarchaeum sp.]